MENSPSSTKSNNRIHEAHRKVGFFDARMVIYIETTLTAVCRECKNYHTKTVERGKFTIAGGVVAVMNTYLVGQYVRIVGSVLNDGVYKVVGFENGNLTLDGVQNEVFTGAVCGLAVPPDFLELVGDIDRFITAERADKNAGRVTSESFAGYSYTLGSTGQDGTPISWKEAFASPLNDYRYTFEVRVI